MNKLNTYTKLLSNWELLISGKISNVEERLKKENIESRVDTDIRRLLMSAGVEVHYVYTKELDNFVERSRAFLIEALTHSLQEEKSEYTNLLRNIDLVKSCLKT